ncbi:MAG TPA: phosphoserine phosphatase SerB [Rhizobiaceae bacterium]|nr:phosphoserine phosphatase SerB [Rhizobiaceae bacterium]
MSLLATLIANPENPVVDEPLATAAARLAGGAEIDWLAPGIACDLILPVDAPLHSVKAELGALLAGREVDLAVQQSATRRKKVLIADMDSTMIEQECIDELADMAGFRDLVSNITARSMNGEIEFEEALRERVALLKGLPSSVIGEVLANRISLAPGGRELVATMKANGGWAALVSGGFTAFTGPVASMLGFDEHQANILEESGGMLDGTVREPILGRQAKADALTAIAERLGLTPEDFIAVGDGANDLQMLAMAGTGVALHAKPAVAKQARIRIDHGDLTALLYLQGYRSSQFVP